MQFVISGDKEKPTELNNADLSQSQLKTNCIFRTFKVKESFRTKEQRF